MNRKTLEGTRWVIERGTDRYPKSFEQLDRIPEKLYLIGDPDALTEGLAIIGARRATPYGRACSRRFSSLAAQRGITIVSGGALGCDSEAHNGALKANGRTIAFLGGGCDHLYPAANADMFQKMVDSGGAVVSEFAWQCEPRPYAFRMRNRLIAALSKAVLIVEAGLPSGTFSTADEALSLGREVLVVPGAITSQASHGSNRLLFQGATPVIDDESFGDTLERLFGLPTSSSAGSSGSSARGGIEGKLLEAILASPMDIESLYKMVVDYVGEDDARGWLMEKLTELESSGLIARYLDGRWGPSLKC